MTRWTSVKTANNLELTRNNNNLTNIESGQFLVFVRSMLLFSLKKVLFESGPVLCT
jgi:hypothetical protein